jgi:hypothetical protein
LTDENVTLISSTYTWGKIPVTSNCKKSELFSRKATVWFCTCNHNLHMYESQFTYKSTRIFWKLFWQKLLSILSHPVSLKAVVAINFSFSCSVIIMESRNLPNLGKRWLFLVTQKQGSQMIYICIYTPKILIKKKLEDLGMENVGIFNGRL